MPVDTSIYSNYLKPPPSVADFTSQSQGIEQNALKLDAQRQTMAEAAQVASERGALRNALSSGLDPTTPEGRVKLYQVAPTMAPGILKTMQDQLTSQAKAGLDTAQAGHVGAQTAQVKAQTAATALKNAATFVFANPTPENARRAVLQLALDQGGDPTADLQQLSQLTTPDQIKQWAAGHALQADKLLPTTHFQDTGGASNVVSVPALGGPLTVLSSTPKTQSPDSVASNATQQRGQNISAQTAREGHANALQIAGMTPGGTLDDNSERTAQAIAKGQLPAPTGMALLNPKNQRILGRVMEINPGYDYTDVTAKKAAATAFTSGSQGNALRAVSTANAHLDQLGELVDALGNRDTQLINRIGNAYATATGNPAPTNFDAVKNVIGQEVVKAIVAGGGSAGERDEAAKAFSNASSPAQLKGAIQHYRMIMGAQADNLMAQRRAAGLSDRTLPQYNQTTQPGQAPTKPTVSNW